MFLIANKRFQAEITRLGRLLALSQYSFTETHLQINQKIHSGELDRDTIIASTEFAPFTVNRLHGMLESQAPRYLRELIFVRLISALEVYLIDSIKEVASINPLIFKSQDILQFSKSEILSHSSIENLFLSIIEKDCRTLSSGGFDEITRYYKNKLSIDYSDTYPGIGALKEYHDRRHLLVHRLGSTDERYRHQYNSSRKKIYIDLDYLSQAIKSLSSFSSSHNQLVLNLLFNTSFNEISPPQYRCIIILEGSIEEHNLLKPGFPLSESTTLGQITKSSKVRGRRIEFILEGDRGTVDSYVNLIKEQHRMGNLRFLYTNPRKIGRIWTGKMP